MTATEETPTEDEDTEARPPAQADESPGANARATGPIIGIGSSAGGIESLKRLFPQVAPDCGMAFVVVQHLDPVHESMLSEIVGRNSRLPVEEAADGARVEPNHVYVIPPNATLTIRDGRLNLAHPSHPPRYRNTIDEFFTSLALDQAENAGCVVLSGTGSDGTIGLRAIKENGGVTLAQAEAEYDGMMRSAVATGLVDFVLPVEQIPAKLAEYFRHVGKTDHGKEAVVPPGAADCLNQIISLLRTHTGHDFSGYKDRTIVRRVQRRMHVLQIEDLPTFIERLRKEPREATLLFHDLLIGVTNFFRDPEAFNALEQTVVPQLFKGKGADDTVRVWVPGCSTGEEAYSIAILLREAAPKTQGMPKLQIFATDIDENALETARLGRYPAAIAKDVPVHRLKRYFTREDGTYRVVGDLREICLFSLHNLLRDPPFSRVDLISCRNLLIYLSAELQNRIIPLFHYSLNQNGFLFLGTSENVTRHSRLFLPVDKGHRLFRRRAHLERQVPQFPLTALPPSRRLLPRPARYPPVVEPGVKATAERQLLDHFAPAYVVVNAEGDVLQSSARTGKYLELPPGAPDTNLFSMARPDLRIELRAAFHKAVRGGQPKVRTRTLLGVNGGQQEIEISIQPLRFESPPDTLYMIVFQDQGTVKPAASLERLPADEAERADVRRLETELQATRERLQITTEELESSNEELQSINEEMQSTNEELETSKEELQSINEELQTVNAELNARVEELSRANNDITNLLESTQIATVFLDRALAVKSFTPAAKDLFRFVESDTGRPITHVRARFDCDTLQADAERVLRTLERIDRPVRSNENDTRYIMRLLPYRTADNVINGVVMTFTDVTQTTLAEERITRLTADLRARINELETLLELVPVGVMIAEEDGGVLINAYGARLFGGEDAAKGLTPAPTAFRLFTGDQELALAEQPLQRARRTGKAVHDWQGRLETGGGRSAHVLISATPLFAGDGVVRGAIAAIVDVSQGKKAEEQRQLLLNELQHRVKNILATISSLAARMLRTARTIDDFRKPFLARIAAMARLHDLLVSGAWGGARLKSLVAAALDPYVSARGSNVHVAGTDLLLPAGTATTLGMIFYELATNAAKYGALSLPGGTVDISWSRLDGAQGGDRLHIEWSERGGPAVDPESRPGFGLGFITRGVAYELNGTANVELAPTGLHCVIEFPLAEPRQPPPFPHGDDHGHH